MTCRPGIQGSAQARWQDKPRTWATMDKPGDDPLPMFSLRLEKVPASTKQELHRWLTWMPSLRVDSLRRRMLFCTLAH